MANKDKATQDMTHAGYRGTENAREVRRLLNEVFARSLPAPLAKEYAELLVDELIELMAFIAGVKVALHEGVEDGCKRTS